MVGPNQGQMGEADEAVHEKRGNRLVRATTTASSLEAEQDSGVNTHQSDEDRLQHNELMRICTILQKRVLNLEDDLKKKRPLTKRRIDGIDADEDITLVITHDDVCMHDEGNDVIEEEVVEDIITTKLIVDVSVAGDQEVSAVNVPVSAATPTIKIAQPTIATKTVQITAPKVKGIMIQEPVESTTTTTTFSSKQPQVKDKSKGKEKMIEPEHVKSLKKRTQEQIRMDEELVVKLQAGIDKEARIARERAQQEIEANEQQVLIDAEKAKLFVEFIEKRRKFFAAKRAEKKRNKPPTKDQQRKIMCTYLRNMEGYKAKYLKVFDFDTIQKKFDKAFKRVNTFEDYRTELVEGQGKDEREGEGKAKRAGEALMQEQERAKKQKVDDDTNTTKLNELIEIIPNEEEVAIDAIPLAVRTLFISWKIHKEGKKSYYHIFKAGGKTQYLVFSHMLRTFDKEDLEDL
ncbi:hypothetical protein Tco_0256581 [Tanacetum coccineum]